MSRGPGEPIDATTARRDARPVAAEAAAQPALTVLWHPDPARVGDLALLGDLARQDAGLSRLEPELGPPDGGPRAPLADRHLSRTPVKLRAGAGGAIVVRAPAEVGLTVDGAPVDGERVIDGAAIDRGAVLLLADRVALLLHRRRPPVAGGPRFGMVGDSDAIARVRADIARVADLDVPVLLTGPSGAGKELVACALHIVGRRATRPFVAVNLTTLPPTLAAAELFGHGRGAFTGATSAHDGLIRRAAGGTLFLDEIGEAPLDVQAMLLRALESGEIQPLGEQQAAPVDVRWVAATDADLAASAAAGRFREPLRHRLAGYEIRIPPLRERRDDLGRLLLAFLREELLATGEPDRLRPVGADQDPWLPAALVAGLARYDWPGNVRELRNAARQLVISSRGRARVEPDERIADLLGAAGTAAAGPGGDAGQRTAALDDDALVTALRRHRFHIGATAAALGVSRTTLYAWMERCAAVRKAADLPADEIRAQLHGCAGDVDAAAEALQVSPRGLRLRMKQLGIA